MRFRRGGENPVSGLDDRGEFGAGLGSDFRVLAGRKGQDCTRQDGGDPAQALGGSPPALSWEQSGLGGT